MKIVIVDAGPLIALSRIAQLELLRELFEQVTITETIKDEVLVNKHSRGKDSVQQAIEAGWMKVTAADQKTGNRSIVG